MKTLTNFLTNHPSYVKCGPQVISKYSGISVNAVKTFKRSTTFKNIKESYGK